MAAREEILNRIKVLKQGKVFNLPEDPEWEEEALAPINDSLINVFKEELEKVSGKCEFVKSREDLATELASYLEDAEINSIACLEEDLASLLPENVKTSDVLHGEAAITTCECLVARTGSALVSSHRAKSRQIQVFPPIHIIVAKESQLVPYLSDAIGLLKTTYGKDLPSQVSLITGPSRTADIEKTLVLGAHGPKELVVFIIKD